MTSMETTVATKKRLGAYSGGKASYSSVAGNIFGNFQPLTPNQLTEGLGIIGQPYLFVTQGDVDIKAADILTIDSLDYKVKGVRRQQNGSIDALEVTLELPTAS